jgi:hypothetical protein
MIDIASEGARIEKTPEEVQDLILKMTVNPQQFGVHVNSFKIVIEVIHSNIETQLSKLTSLVRQVVLGQVRYVKVCDICSFLDYPTDRCPQL